MNLVPLSLCRITALSFPPYTRASSTHDYGPPIDLIHEGTAKVMDFQGGALFLCNAETSRFSADFKRSLSAFEGEEYCDSEIVKKT